ncbi:MAG TPA: hypothetical protein PLU17_07795 [Chitinophagaceae bacterium]|nr:hypothetical protein [Chitinophagaceae bacterium]
MYNIHLLPASFGDSILIEYGNLSKKYILIDGGPYFNFEILIKSIKKIAPNLKELELLVITHIDIDHIDGTILLLNQKELPFKIKEIWFNGLNEMQEAHDDLLGVTQGEYISALIRKHKLPHNISFNKKAVMVTDNNHLPIIKLADGMTITLLGPNITGLEAMRLKWEDEVKAVRNESAILKRLEGDSRYEEEIDDLLGCLSIEDMQKAILKGDTSAANGSSIAFIATYKNASCLFTGDLFSAYLQPALEAYLEKIDASVLKIDAWKLAHHGSKKSTLESVMKLIDTPNILISSDGKRYHHPDKETIAKILKFKKGEINFYFNYTTQYNEMWNNQTLMKKYKYKAHYPKNNEENGISITL